MRTAFRKAAIAIFALLGAGVAHANAAGRAFDLAREGSLYICPDANLVDDELYASECFQGGAKFGASQLGGGAARGASNPPLVSVRGQFD
jgi:hypothetical protein